MEKKKQSVVTVVRTTAASLIWQSARQRKIVYGLANTRAVNGIQERIESAKVSGDNLVEKLYYVIPTEGGYRNSWNYYIDDDSKGEKQEAQKFFRVENVGRNE